MIVSLLLLSQLSGLRSRTPILTYHDFVSRRDARSLWFDCTPAEFKTQLGFFQRHHARFLSLKDIEQAIKSRKRLPDHAIVLTFADNYDGFWRYAYPILKAKRIPCAMFVHTGYVGDRHGRPKMTWAQLRQLDREGLVTVASQTVSHPADLRNLPDDQLDRELVESKAKLESELGHAVQALVNVRFLRANREEEATFLISKRGQKRRAERSVSRRKRTSPVRRHRARAAPKEYTGSWPSFAH